MRLSPNYHGLLGLLLFLQVEPNLTLVPHLAGLLVGNHIGGAAQDPVR